MKNISTQLPAYSSLPDTPLPARSGQAGANESEDARLDRLIDEAWYEDDEALPAERQNWKKMLAVVPDPEYDIFNGSLEGYSGRSGTGAENRPAQKQGNIYNAVLTAEEAKNVQVEQPSGLPEFNSSLGGYQTTEVASAGIIKDNTQYIISAAEKYGVDPAVVAGCIYEEQVKNVNWIDSLTDRALYFFDTSVGVGQVKISTARMLEDMGYMEVTRPYKIYGNRMEVSRDEAIADKLLDNETNINYIAAYLKYWQDQWEAVYPQISGSPDILGTLYNVGVEANAPNTNPQTNPFGYSVGENYNYMRELLGLN